MKRSLALLCAACASLWLTACASPQRQAKPASSAPAVRQLVAQHSLTSRSWPRAAEATARATTTTTPAQTPTPAPASIAQHKNSPSPAATPDAVVQSGSASAGSPGTPAARGTQGVPGPTVWERLAWCESRNRWHINTGNGYYGGLQEDMQFWRTYSTWHTDPKTGKPALDYARADLAPKAAQIAAATKARDGGRGYTPWPVCAKRLGLI